MVSSVDRCRLMGGVSLFIFLDLFEFYLFLWECWLIDFSAQETSRHRTSCNPCVWLREMGGRNTIVCTVFVSEHSATVCWDHFTSKCCCSSDISPSHKPHRSSNQCSHNTKDDSTTDRQDIRFDIVSQGLQKITSMPSIISTWEVHG